MVTSGFLPGDDWETEYEAMTTGGELFFTTLVTYLSHFAGLIATPVTAFGPPITHWGRAWSLLRRELGLPDEPGVGTPVRYDQGGLRIEGVVYHVNSQTLGVRTDDALYRFVQGLGGSMVASHHLFADDLDASGAERTWLNWLVELFG
jgi:hypothetical protein